MSESVVLVTANGGRVASIDLPPFDPPPEIVVWGSRTFVRDKPDGSRYREGMAWVVPQHEVDRSTGMLCPEHGIRFASVETMAAGGRRVCERGEMWRYDGGQLSRV